MGKNFTAAFAVCLAISSLPLACGDDEEPSGNGKGGSGGDGTGGKATGGTAGKATGGTAGKATGGTAGKATGGAAGKATGGTAGTAGIGGADGGVGGADGGVGGEGGAPVMSLCERFCADGEVANCANSAVQCAAQCEEIIAYGISVDPACEGLLTTFYECNITGTTGTWVCNGNQPNYQAGECVDESMAANDAFCFG